MKKPIRYFALIFFIGATLTMESQTLPSGTPPPGITPFQAAAAWYRGGNGPASAPNNIFGTTAGFNSGIFTRTNGVNRMRLNGTVSYPVNGFAAAAKDGFLLLGANNTVGGGSLYGTANRGAFSLLHLSSGVGVGAQEFGYRPWMSYGITSTHNQDFMFMGQRATAGVDVTDAVFGWADNGAGPPGPVGPDNMVFTFLTGDASTIGAPNADLTGQANFGREIVRYTGTGQVGIGPRFNNANQPKSTLHQHQENALSSWMQITNQRMSLPFPPTGPTPINPTNGLRLGIVGDAVLNQNGDGLLYNQENRHLIFSTNHATPGSILTTNERMRMSSLSAPTENPAGAYVGGGYNPGGIILADATRIGVSYLPLLPVTAPLSLMHLGGNTTAANDGWRNWMDVGTFVNIPLIGGVQGGNFYSGMRFAATASSITAVRDAVINWGFSPTNAASNGNKLRFIFTTTTGGGLLSSGQDGLEAGHFTSDGNNTRLGIGNFAAGTAIPDPNNTCEIKASPSSFNWPPANPGGTSGLRLSYVTTTTSPIPNPGQGVLAVSPNGDVIYVQTTSSTSFAGACPAVPLLPSNFGTNMNAKNFYWEGNGAGNLVNNVVLGQNCGTIPRGKLDVLQASGSHGSTGIYVMNTDPAVVSGPVIGIESFVPGVLGGPSLGQTAGKFTTSGEKFNVSVDALANGFPGSGATLNIAGRFEAVNGFMNWGVYGIAPNTGSGNDLAGNFSGDVFVNGINSGVGYLTVSDRQFKKNIQPVSNSMEVIKKLAPKTYDFKKDEFPEMRFRDKKQYGLIAQEVEEVIPEAIYDIKIPATLDSKGNITKASYDAKAVNYDALVSVLIQGMKDQQTQIEAQTKQNEDLKKQIDELRNMITSCCSNANPSVNNKNVAQINVELKDGDAVVLNQNVPNPFAEQTVITYNVPEKIQSAQIIFYNNLGQVLKTIDIKTRGKGQLNVYANDLTNGLYSYSLIIDGKVADTKKMIKH